MAPDELDAEHNDHSRRYRSWLHRMATDQEKVDILKWLKGFATPTTWAKSLIYLIMGLIILFVALSILGRGSNVHKPFLVALPGSTVMNPDLSSKQEMEQKRPWWRPIPYIAVFGGASSRGTSKFDFEPEYGAQVGIRWDF